MHIVHEKCSITFLLMMTWVSCSGSLVSMEVIISGNCGSANYTFYCCTELKYYNFGVWLCSKFLPKTIRIHTVSLLSDFLWRYSDMKRNCEVIKNRRCKIHPLMPQHAHITAHPAIYHRINKQRNIAWWKMAIRWLF